jgi:long-chain acyl-CoA synthetase
MNSGGNEVPVGEVGEICGRGPILMPGYYKRPDLTAEAIKDGWLHSGDMGYVDEDGFLYWWTVKGYDHFRRGECVSPRH